jgi:hypothetical protein
VVPEHTWRLAELARTYLRQTWCDLSVVGATTKLCELWKLVEERWMKRVVLSEGNNYSMIA